MDEYAGSDMDYAKSVKLSPCKICGRTFVPETLAKHVPICQKSLKSTAKRKVFDSSKQRAEGTEITARQLQKAKKTVVAPPKSHWREKHEDFIRTVRNARGVTVALKTGAPLPEHIPSVNPDYEQCPYCSRRFNAKAAERHINFCKEQAQRNPRAPPNATAKAKMDARNKFVAPKPKSRTAPGAAPSPGYGNPGSGGTSRGPPPGGRGAAAGGGMSRAPPAASNGYGRQPATGTRGRPAGGMGQTQARDNYDNPNGLESFGGNGKALRTGRDNRAYEDARAAILRDGGRPPKSKSSNNRGGPPPGPHGISSVTTPPNRGYGREWESGYHSNSPDNDYVPPQRIQRHTPTSTKSVPPKFCYECGAKYPVAAAKFCCECGVKRMAVS